MGAIEKKDLIHPKVKVISDGIAFKLARLVAVHEKHGNYNFNKKFGLSLNEWRVLGLVNEMEPVFSRDIRVMLNIDKGQLSRAIKQLVKKEILLSKEPREDARLKEITTTLKGKKLHDMMLKFSTDRNEEIVQGVTRSEFKEFVRILEKITKSSISLSLKTKP